MHYGLFRIGLNTHLYRAAAEGRAHVRQVLADVFDPALNELAARPRSRPTVCIPDPDLWLTGEASTLRGDIFRDSTRQSVLIDIQQGSATPSQIWRALITVTQRAHDSGRQANMAGLARYLVTSASAV